MSRIPYLSSERPLINDAAQFSQFFRTRSGRLTLFGLLFAGALLILSALRKQGADDAGMITSPATNRADTPQVVQTVQRAMEIFRPPPPKPEPPRPPAPVVTNAPVAALPAALPPRSPEPLLPISLFADSAADIPESKKLSGIYAPYGRLIPCETVITVDSASIQTPIIGLVTEGIYHAGKLVIPAGTEVHGTAQSDRHRERIASGNNWTLVWQSGEELRLKAIALDREFASGQEGWGITDGSAGLRGRVIKSDDMAEIKLFAATFLSGAAGALTEKQPTVFGPVNSPSLNNAPFQGAQEVLKIYAQRISEAIQRDGFYVRVPSGKQFYLYVVQTIDRADALIGGMATPFADEKESGRRARTNETDQP